MQQSRVQSFGSLLYSCNETEYLALWQPSSVFAFVRIVKCLCKMIEFGILVVFNIH